jgi:hypothetical protein
VAEDYPPRRLFACFWAQRVCAALRAISWRRLAFKILALAFPPFEGAPFATANFANPTANGFFFIIH